MYSVSLHLKHAFDHIIIDVTVQHSHDKSIIQQFISASLTLSTFSSLFNANNKASTSFVCTCTGSSPGAL